jgi:hypothetical protein
VLPTPNPVTPTEGAVIVRLGAPARSWAGTLPEVPGGRLLTLTVGHPSLLPVAADALASRGYRLVGVAADHRPIGFTVDILVPAEVRTAHPGWWTTLVGRAERVFDLRHGPVQRVLAAELELHLRPEAG